MDGAPTCTWRDCQRPAAIPQRSDTGEEWANLCAQHAAALDAAENDLAHPARLIGAWIAAQGGAAQATKRMEPAIQAGAKLMELLSLLQQSA